jgi:hypothetical protein
MLQRVIACVTHFMVQAVAAPEFSSPKLPDAHIVLLNFVTAAPRQQTLAVSGAASGFLPCVAICAALLHLLLSPSATLVNGAKSCSRCAMRIY